MEIKEIKSYNLNFIHPFINTVCLGVSSSRVTRKDKEEVISQFSFIYIFPIFKFLDRSDYFYSKRFIFQ